MCFERNLVITNISNINYLHIKLRKIVPLNNSCLQEEVGENEAEAETHKNRGNTLMHEAHVEEALEAYNK